MLEELRLYFQESPDRLLGFGVLAFFCLLLVLVPLTRSVRANFGQWLLQTSFVQRIGQWFMRNPEPIALGIGVLCLLGTIALLVDPVRLLMHGTSADGVVTTVVKSRYEDTDHKTRIRSTATIRFSAGERIMEIQYSTIREPGTWCIGGCYEKGDRLKVLYLAEDPAGAKVRSFPGLFSGPLMAGITGGLAFLFWWVMRSKRTASSPGT